MNNIGKIPAENLTAKFVFGEKECLIGKFDPSNPAVLLAVPFEKLGQELMDQIEDSGVFTQDELEQIAMFPAETFLSLIIEL
jgi:hypothetical protein